MKSVSYLMLREHRVWESDVTFEFSNYNFSAPSLQYSLCRSGGRNPSTDTWNYNYSSCTAPEVSEECFIGDLAKGPLEASFIRAQRSEHWRTLEIKLYLKCLNPKMNNPINVLCHPAESVSEKRFSLHSKKRFYVDLKLHIQKAHLLGVMHRNEPKF